MIDPQDRGFLVAGTRTGRCSHGNSFLTEIEKIYPNMSMDELEKLKRVLKKLEEAGLKGNEAGKKLREALQKTIMDNYIIDNIKNEKNPGKFIKESKQQLRKRMKSSIK